MSRLNKHLPQHINDIREFQELDKSISPELDTIDADTLEHENNQFIHSAIESGLSRYEKMFGIVPVSDIDIRRLNILNLYNTNANYTMPWLRSYLSTLVGEGNFLILLNGFTLSVSIGFNKSHLRESIYQDLRRKIPANIQLDMTLLSSTEFDLYTAFIHRIADKLKI